MFRPLNDTHGVSKRINQMATSANTLSLIIDEMISSKPADRAAAIELLSAKGYLPKKLADEKPKAKDTKISSIFASKAAEDFAEAHSIVVPEGFKGTANGDKISVKDLKKMTTPPKKNVNASPSALQFCRDNNIDIGEVSGTGTDGKILLKDVKKLVPETPKTETETEKIKISPAAAKILKDNEIDEQDVIDSGIKGTGEDGVLTIDDLKPLIDLAKEEEKDSDELEPEDKIE